MHQLLHLIKTQSKNFIESNLIDLKEVPLSRRWIFDLVTDMI